MNCDTAFDLMTDPAAWRSASLAEHLENCPRCRQMRETLEPALDWLSEGSKAANLAELFEGTPAPDESSRSGRKPLLTAEAVEVAQTAAARLATNCQAPGARWRAAAGRFVRYATVCAAGGLIALAVLDYSSQRGRGMPPVIEGTCTRKIVDEQSGLSFREAQALVQSCVACHDPEKKPGRAPQDQPVETTRGPAGLVFPQFAEARFAGLVSWTTL